MNTQTKEKGSGTLFVAGVLTVVFLSLPLSLSFAAQEAPSGDGSTPLHWAAYRDDLTKANQLIRAGANVNAANDLGATPLWAASLNGSVDMVRTLLDAGASPNAPLLSGETPLMAASRAGKPLVVEQLLRRGANPNSVPHAARRR